MTLQDVLAARRRIAGLVRRTPLVRSEWLSALSGADVFLKLESLQVTNSFKARGAANAALALGERLQPGQPPARLVTASAGNHGRALAWAGRQLGFSTVVFTPRDAPTTKREAIARLGADLRAEADGYEDSERRAKAFAAAEGLPYVSPYSHPDIIAGAATAGLEVLEDVPDTDLVVVPVGGGGLLAGVAAVVKSINPRIQVIGAEAAASPAFSTSLSAGRIVEVEVRPTLADGLAGNMDPDTITFELVRRAADRVVAVEERWLREGIRELIAHEHLVAEGAGVVGIAALLAGLLPSATRTAIVVSGSNIDLSRLAPLLSGA